MPTVCIDGYNLAMPRGSGIATYGRNLLQNLREVGLSTQVLYAPAALRGKNPLLNEIALTDAFTPDQQVRGGQRIWEAATARFGRPAYGIEPSGEVIWPAARGGRPAADGFWSAPRVYDRANRAFRRNRSFTPIRFQPHEAVARPDAFHWTTLLPMEAEGALNIYTIHDMIPLRLPHTTLDNKKVFLNLSKAVARRADHIVVVSEATKRDVVRLTGIEEARVTNTYQSVHVPAALAGRDQAEVARELEGIFDLGWKDYFLYFGAIEPKKNLGRIVEAYLSSGSKRPLVVIGGRAWLEQDETALMNQVIKTMDPEDLRIRQYDFMPFAMLVSLIRGARATLFPSLYEGFGLPVLESMLLGTAVLTSDAASLPEVAGDAALTVDPYDTRAIANGIRQLDVDDAVVDDLVVRGRAQAAKFTPEAYQARLRDLYGRLGVL
jgi:glycosyltransferase involved in cell wall biosynthesis